MKPEVMVRVSTNLSPHCKAIVDVLGGEFYMDTEYDKKTVASFWFPCKMRDTQKEHRAFSID